MKARTQFHCIVLLLATGEDCGESHPNTHPNTKQNIAHARAHTHRETCQHLPPSRVLVQARKSFGTDEDCIVVEPERGGEGGGAAAAGLKRPAGALAHGESHLAHAPVGQRIRK